MSRSIPSIVLLRKCVEVCPDEGRLVWLPRPAEVFTPTLRRSAAHLASNWNSRYAGTPAFNCLMPNGYRKGSFFGAEFLAHRVMWALVHGDWPSLGIDHINGDRGDNRISNLRCTDPQGNARNATRSKANTSGCTGVYFNKAVGKWQAYITVNRKAKNLGVYTDIEAAVAARKAAEAEHGFHVNHGRPPS